MPVLQHKSLPLQQAVADEAYNHKGLDESGNKPDAPSSLPGPVITDKKRKRSLEEKLAKKQRRAAAKLDNTVQGRTVIFYSQEKHASANLPALDEVLGSMLLGAVIYATVYICQLHIQCHQARTGSALFQAYAKHCQSRQCPERVL